MRTHTEMVDYESIKIMEDAGWSVRQIVEGRNGPSRFGQPPTDLYLVVFEIEKD